MTGILVPLDLAEAPGSLLETMREISAGGQRKIDLLHVIETLRDTPVEDLEDFYREIEERSRKRLGALREELVAQGLEVTVDVRYGSRVEQILEYVRDNDISLIVMRSHPVDRDSAATALATISYQIAVLAPCSVYLVKVGSGRKES